LNSEKTGRLFVSGGGELSSAGDEGGDDRVSASEKLDGDGCGLELRGAELTRAGDGDRVVIDFAASAVGDVGSVSTSSTRLRLAGGSAS
jgi:hypothetical protein